MSFLTLSIGKTYDGRAATPVAQIAADVATEAATRLKEYIDSLPIDPKLDENCLILDNDNVTVLGRFGQPTKNKYYCEQDGFLVPIGHELNRDKKVTKLCRDDALRDCLLERHGKEWVPVHRPHLDGTCRMTDSDGLVLGYLGQPTPDGKACRYESERNNGTYGKYKVLQEQRIGEQFYTDANRAAVCLDAEMQRCFMTPPPGRRSLAWSNDERATTALVEGFSEGLTEQADGVKQAAKAAASVATGKVKMTTIAQEIRRAAEDAANGAKSLIKEPDKRAAVVNAARGKAHQLEKAIDDWQKMSPEEQMEAAARTTGKLASDAAVNTVVNAVTPGGILAGTATKTLEKAAAASAEKAVLREAEKEAKKKSAQAAERAAAEKAEKDALRASSTISTISSGSLPWPSFLQVSVSRWKTSNRKLVNHPSGWRTTPTADVRS